MKYILYGWIAWTVGFFLGCWWAGRPKEHITVYCACGEEGPCIDCKCGCSQ